VGDASLHCYSGTWPVETLLSSALLPGAFEDLNPVFGKGENMNTFIWEDFMS